MATRIENIAHAIMMCGHRAKIRETGDVQVTFADVATEAKLPEDTVRMTLLQQGPKVWGKLPLGWRFTVSAVPGDTIHVMRQRGA